MQNRKIRWLIVVAIVIIIFGPLFSVWQIGSKSEHVSAAPDQQISLGGNESPKVKSFEKTDISANGYYLYLLYIDVSMQPDKVCPVWVKDGTEPPITQGCA